MENNLNHIILNKNNIPEAVYSAYTERKVARVVIVKDGKVFLIHSTKYNTYTLPGGGVEAGETSEQAAIREVKEETGMEVSIGQELGTTTEVYDIRGILNVTSGFAAQLEVEHDLVPSDPNSVEEGQELLWVPLSEAIALIESVNISQNTTMLREVFFIQQYINLVNH